MKSTYITIALAMCTAIPAGAATLDLTVGMPAEDLRMFVRPVNDTSREALVELTADESHRNAKGQVNVNPDGLYYLFVSNSNAQYSLPFYIPADKPASEFSLILDGTTTATSLSDNVNSALNTYTTSQTQNSKILGAKAESLSPEQIRSMLTGCITEADSLICLGHLPTAVADFMRIQAYIAASDAYRFADYMAMRAKRQLGFGSADILPAASTVLDTPMAASFPTAPQIIIASLPQGTLEERLAALDNIYKTPEIKGRIRELLVSSFIDSFDYANDFANGEARLKAVVEQYSLPQTYLTIFRARLATIPGTPFPAGVTLVDNEGNKVDFSKFKGKFVYVDLWASWCGPCCKEVPYLQELEKDFENSDVVFVSISIDSAKEPWLKKMGQLNMHGNQLWNSDGELPKQLNIRGIPHFLIYDREGKLLDYDAPRPSSEKIKALLQSLK